MTGPSLVGAAVTVSPTADAEWPQFHGVIRGVYVGGERLRAIVKPDDHDRLYDVPVHACWLHEQAPPATDDELSGAMARIATAAIDYAMERPASDEGNLHQAELIASVTEWLRLDDRAPWVTALCGAGQCVDCQHASCECPHHGSAKR